MTDLTKLTDSELLELARKHYWPKPWKHRYGLGQCYGCGAIKYLETTDCPVPPPIDEKIEVVAEKIKRMAIKEHPIIYSCTLMTLLGMHTPLYGSGVAELFNRLKPEQELRAALMVLEGE